MGVYQISNQNLQKITSCSEKVVQYSEKVLVYFLKITAPAASGSSQASGSHPGSQREASALPPSTRAARPAATRAHSYRAWFAWQITAATQPPEPRHTHRLPHGPHGPHTQPATSSPAGHTQPPSRCPGPSHPHRHQLGSQAAARQRQPPSRQKKASAKLARISTPYVAKSHAQQPGAVSLLVYSNIAALTARA